MVNLVPPLTFPEGTYFWNLWCNPVLGQVTHVWFDAAFVANSENKQNKMAIIS